MNPHRIVVLVLLASPAMASAQSTVSGSAEWTVANAASVTDGQTNSNGAVWQNYSLGFHSSLWDPRLLKYDSEVTFRTNRLRAQSNSRGDENGRQDDLGFRLGAFLLPAGAVPFYVQASRVFTGSTGELAFANTARGGFARTPGATAAALDSEERQLNLGGQLNVEGLPRAEVSYRRGNTLMTGGSEQAEQRDDDLAASIVKETPRMRQGLRYQRTGYEYQLAQAFGLRLENLDYDFNARVWGHVQFTARAGQRRTSTTSDLLTGPRDTGEQPYTPPPTDTGSETQYATSGVSYEPTSRLTLRLNGTWDQQRSAIASTSAMLATGSLHADVVRGLAVNATGTSGQRGQIIDGALTQVVTSNGVAGFTYSDGPRWLSATLTGSIGQGTNTTPQGEWGITRSWAREASLSSSIAWFGVGAGYERVRSQDAILDYGNYDSERVRASLNVQFARVSIDGSADQLNIVRGHNATLARNRQQTFSAVISGRLWREILVSGTAGGFATTYASQVGGGLDRSLFWGVGTQAAFGGVFRASAWVRSEDVAATATRFTQKGLSSLARLDYRLRTLNFALEYRYNDSLLQYGGAPAPSLYRGHQLRFSLTRQFGFRV